MENTSNDTTGNRTRDLLTCSTVPQPTAPPRTSKAPKTSDKSCQNMTDLKYLVTTPTNLYFMREDIKSILN